MSLPSLQGDMYDRSARRRLGLLLAGSVIQQEFTSAQCNPGSAAFPTEERAEAGSDKHMSEGSGRHFHLTLFFKHV